MQKHPLMMIEPQVSILLLVVLLCVPLRLFWASLNFDYDYD